MMTRDGLEQHQVWWYLGAVLIGGGIGLGWPAGSQLLDALVWPVLGVLLYATFAQLHLGEIPRSFHDGRFLTAALIGNFVLIPIVVLAIVQFMPEDEALILGLLLVLLVPCTDWFITFSQLGGGDGLRATALTPIVLFLQLGLLPLYLVLFTDFQISGVLGLGELLPALLVIAFPLLAAALTELGSRQLPWLDTVRDKAGWFPVPMLAVVILLVVASHTEPIRENLVLVPWVVLAGLLFLTFGLLISKLAATVMKLPTVQGRTLAFSFGTRNSFIVLPFALSLPAGWEIAAIVIVIQSLVELFGMIFYVWFVPTKLFPNRVTRTARNDHPQSQSPTS